MAIRNYVGARYVPKFADPVEWQANTSYEAMVIVTYNNASYTSKVPVPPTVGNPAENSTYWALTGNYNAQVEEYRQETVELKTKTDTIESELSSHINNKANPHGVTKAQVGLGNVDNISKANILLSVYPVGSIYRSTASTSPAELFGGTWERIKDRFLLAAGDTYTAGSTGGEAEHVLTKDEMPRHSHEQTTEGNNDNPIPIVLKNSTGHGSENGTSLVRQDDWIINATPLGTFDVGGSQPHNNMPPYVAVYMWKRVA